MVVYCLGFCAVFWLHLSVVCGYFTPVERLAKKTISVMAYVSSVSSQLNRLVVTMLWCGVV